MPDVSPDLVRVRLNVALAPGLILEIDREHGMFQVVIGSWLVEANARELIVRKPGSAINETPLLKVPV